MPFNDVQSGPVAAYGGFIASGGPKYARSKRVETAIKPGQLAKYGTTQNQIKPVFTGDTVTLGMLAGVVLADETRPYEDVSASALQPGASAAVLRHGVVYLEFEAAVTEGHLVAYKLADGSCKGYPEGTVAAGVTTGYVLIPGLRVAETTSAAGVATVEVNFLGATSTAAVVGTG